MRSLIPGLLLASLPAILFGQTAGPINMAVPTTRVLAIGHLAGTAPDPQAIRSIMPREVHDTVELYLEGKLDQWFVRQDGKGVVFLLNASSTGQAAEMLSRLPLVQAHRLEFDLMPLGPLSPLHYLIGDSADAAKPR